ncbi:MAG TPA: aminotransferase class IV [Lacisediminihabitans sp.]|nr:aminotransferase class IV [Lacisediminihabitans sp.]HXD60848.1 aminotransferase class IV [Lacisediminihabitans sp.]
MSGGDSPGAASRVAGLYRWQRDELELLDYCDPAELTLEVADSWLVSEGLVLALDLHRSRFFSSIAARGFDPAIAEGFWDAAIAAIPTSGDWFPRVELVSLRGAPHLQFRLRSAPERSRSLVLATYHGDDPRTVPPIKGPDLASMLRIRTEVQALGADDAVLLSALGFVVEGAHTALFWWRGDILCTPAEEFERIDSVTGRSILALATALGVKLSYEAVTPEELEGLEVWAVNALHGIRIVVSWIDGPSTAEQPGRLARWRSLLDTLRKPVPSR